MSGPANVNTGYTPGHFDGQRSVLIYRREEALKTVAHEILHCYGFGDWANHDPEVIGSCHSAADEMGPGWRERFSPLRRW